MAETIFKQLKALQKKAYCKYSHYAVAAIIETDKGIFEGVNVENAAYGVTLCAERNAITTAITNGATKVNKVSLITDSVDDGGTPCGACRQVMVEFMKPNSIVDVYSSKGTVVSYKLQELLPFSFDKEAFWINTKDKQGEKDE